MSAQNQGSDHVEIYAGDSRAEPGRRYVTVHAYRSDPDAAQIELQAADTLGVLPGEVLKTPMTTVDGQPVCAIIPSDRKLSRKRLATTLGGKSAQMTTPRDAERWSGYVVGGISPLGQKRPLPVAIDEQALLLDRVYINAGQRGLPVRLSPRDAARVLDARVAAFVA